MANPTSIGVISIRVTPDASNFRKRLNRTLERIEKTADVDVALDLDEKAKRRVEAEIASIKDTDATVHIDTDKASLAKAKAQLKALSHLSPKKLDFSKASLAKAKAQLSKTLSTTIHPNVNTLAARTQLKVLTRPVRVPVHAVLKKHDAFKRLGRVATLSLARAVRGTSSLSRSFTNTTTSLTRGMFSVSRSTLSLTGKLRDLASGGLKRVNNLARGAGSIFRTMGASTLTAARGITKVSAVTAALIPVLSALRGLAFAGVASGVQGVTTAVAGLWQALVAITPLLGTLPAIIGGGAAGLVALTATVKTAKEGLADYADTFKEMFDNIGRAAWATGGEQVIITVERLIPVLSSGMEKVGAAFGTVMGKVAAQLSSPRALAALSDIMDYTAAAMEPLGDALGWVVDGFLQLARAGAPLLVTMAEYLRDLASNFSAWVNEVYATGRMFVWVDNALHAISQLVRIVRAAIGTFAALGRAMGVSVGGDMLEALARGMESIERAANNPLFQYALVNIFTGAQDAVRALLPGVTHLARTIALMTPLISRLTVIGSAALSQLLSGFADLLSSGNLQQGLTQLFTSVLKLATDLRNFLPTLAPLLGNIARLFGVVISSIGDLLPSLQPLLNVLSQLAVNVGPAVVTVTRNLGAALSDPGLVGGIDALVNSMVSAVAHLSTLLPVLAPVVGILLRLAGGSFSSFADGLTPVVTAFAPVVSRLATQLLPVVQTVISQLATALTNPALVGGVEALGGALIQVIGIAGELLPALAPVIGVLAQLAGVVATSLAGALLPVLQTLAPVVSSLATALIPVVQTVADSLTAALTNPALIAGIQVFINSLVSIIPVIAGLLPTIAPVVGTLLGAVGEIIAALAQGLAPVIETLAPLLVTALTAITPVLVTIIDTIAGALTHLPEVFDWLGKAFGYVFEPLKQAWEAIRPSLEAMWTYITDLFSGMDMGSMFAGLGTALGPVVSVLTTFISLLQDVAVAVGPVLGEAFAALTGDVLPTIVSMWQTLGDTLRDFVGPIFSSLAPAITPIIDTIVSLYHVLAELIIPIISVVMNAIAVAATLLGQILPPILAVVSAVGEAVGVMVQALVPVLNRVFAWLSALIPPITDIFNNISALLIPIIKWLGEEFQRLQPIFLDVVDFIGNLILNLVEVVQGVVGVIVSLLHGDWAAAWDYAKNLVGDVIDSIVDLFLALPEAIWNIVKMLGKVIWDAGYALAGDFLRGIMDVLKKGKDMVANAVKGFFTGGDGGNDGWLTPDPGFGQPDTKWAGETLNHHDIGNKRSGNTTTVNIYNPVNEPSSETLRRNSAHMTGGY